MKMINLTYLLFVVGFIYTTGAEEGCEQIRDIDVILELPELGRVEALKHAKIFFSTLAKKAEHSCWRPRIHVAGSEVYNVNSFDCYSLKCITNGSAAIDADLKRTEINAKENVRQILSTLKKEAFETDTIPGLDGPKRFVLLVLSSRPEGASFIPGHINDLLEGGYNFISVGVGEGKFEPLRSIASRPVNGVVELEEFSQLTSESEEGNIFAILDDPEKADPEVVIGRDFGADAYEGEVCKFIADIAFLIDSSGSVKKNTDYPKLKEFVIKIANKFNISKNGARAGAVVFSDRLPYTKVHSRLTDHESNDAFKTSILAAPHMGYRTRIDLALEKARDDIFDPANGARKGVSKIIFLLTDGKQNPVRTYDPIKVAKTLLDKEVKIFAVGITNSVDQEQLEAITGETERVYYSDNFHSLTEHNFMKTIADATCELIEGSLPPSVEVIPTTTPAPTTTTTTTAEPGECDFPDSEQCKLYKGAKDSYCIREWLKVNCKFMCGICEYEDDTCEKEDGHQCYLYEKGKTVYCKQKWVQTNCKFMCGICIDELASTNTTTTVAPTTGVGQCSTCCHGHSVYLNIFRKDSGPNYVMQGMQLKPHGASLSGIVPTKGPSIQVTQEGKKISLSKFFKVLHEYLPGKPQLVQNIQQMVSDEHQDMLKEDMLKVRPIVANGGLPSVMRTEPLKHHKGGERKRRSLDADTINPAIQTSISNIAGNSGCKLFLEALRNRRLISYIDALIKETKKKCCHFLPYRFCI